ncbi:MAG: acyl-CoA dehydrogenase family protein [Rubrobacteraceae bacterium]|nr:acyl-CoA dehydrogenase family protein [Rubrobacteraceae bacterium]
MTADIGKALGTDYYKVEEWMSEEDRRIRDRVRDFCDREVIPVMGRYWNREEFPFELVPKLAELNIAGHVIPREYGCPEMSNLAAGLVMMELSRGDGSLSTFLGVHSGLAMTSIALCGSEEQRQRWLPQMARLEKIGAFALTEPDHGSDVVMLETTAEKDGDGWVLNGSKRWIGNATFADVVVVWARDMEDGEIKGFLVEKGTEGFETERIEGKIGNRSSWQANITLENVRVPEENRLENANSFADTSTVLTNTRYGVAWQALGHALACYEAAVSYVKEREIFGMPEATFQLTQYRLAGMLADLTQMQLVCFRLAQLMDQGELTHGRASLAKLITARKGRQICAEARDLLGGNGVLVDYLVGKHLADMEIIYTYEGTDAVQSLIVGRSITGEQAFVPAG